MPLAERLGSVCKQKLHGCWEASTKESGRLGLGSLVSAETFGSGNDRLRKHQAQTAARHAALSIVWPAHEDEKRAHHDVDPFYVGISLISGFGNYGCGSKPIVPFWGRCTTHFSLF